MKKQLIGLTILLSSSVCLYSQSPEPSKPVKTGNEWMMPADVFKRSHAFADSLKKIAGLNDEATKKVYNAYLANTKPVDEILIMQASDDEKKEKMKANHQAFNLIIRGILTPDQFAAYLKRDNSGRKKLK